jgi:hypothetical protein
MPPTRRQVEPRTFFLNEAHELSPTEKGRGGALPKFAEIPWSTKAKQISKSLDAVIQSVSASRDPLKEKRLFVLADPVLEVKKRREDKKGNLKEIYKEKTNFGGDHGRVFDRLGLDLLHVTDDGKAVVHAGKETFDTLKERSAELADLGAREQSRWATIESFETIPLQLRVDDVWLKELKHQGVASIIIELQPVITRVEADGVLRAIADLLTERDGERLTGTGTDYSGRHWFRGKASHASVRSIARDFYSVQALHSPLYSIAAAKQQKPQSTTRRLVAPSIPDNVDDLPCIAVVDLGVPIDHKQLKAFKRGQYVPQDAPPPPVGAHGSLVASRIVFGDCPSAAALTSCTGTCRFFDAMVGDYPQGSGRTDLVNDKIVLDAMRGVRATAPDVRVFNLSFGDTRPLSDFPPVERAEKTIQLQDLDNFVFANDAIVVVAAGNSERGVIPSTAYPNHHTDLRWALGPWACGFNTLICGSFVARATVGGLVQHAGWPSPFTRIGPGMCECPVPAFSADGGNTNSVYQYQPDCGVWCFSDSGLTEDHPGTSFAAPLLAREAAFTLHQLQSRCAPGTQPFAVTAKAFLALTANGPTSDLRVNELTARTLGYGTVSANRLQSPRSGSAVFLWQGYVESTSDVVRVQIPIPRSWLDEAEEPILRLLVYSDPPVNAAAHSIWACRRIRPVLHLEPDGDSVRAPAGGHDSYPVIDRRYKLAKHKADGDKPAPSDLWLLELSYEDIAPYYPGIDFDPRQRIAFAAELLDLGEKPVDPQAALQALPAAASMTRLSVQAVPIRSPVIVRTR